jgi:hypothetical protein
MNQRLRAICDLSVSAVREYVGRHEYDGRIEDLSPEGVRAALARVGRPAGTGPEGSGEPQGGAPVGREGSGEPQGGVEPDAEHLEVEVDQETYDRLIAAGEPERTARAKAKAAYARKLRAAQRGQS